MKRYKYDYYDVEVSGDCADSIEELGQVAIAEANDRTRLYFLPASWTAERVVGDVGILLFGSEYAESAAIPDWP